MTPERIEKMMTRMELPWKKVVKDMWSVDWPDDSLPGITLSIEPGETKDDKLLRFIVFVCDVPKGTGPEFFKEFLKLNFKVDHGAFAMESSSEMQFIDTLELENLDENEFEATMKTMIDAPKNFQEKYDINFFTLGKPQF